MNEKVKLILTKTKGKKIGLFIDNANWFYPQRELGWHISFSKLWTFLEKNYQISVAKVYAGTPLTFNNQKTFNKFRYSIEQAGFTLITKPLKKIWTDRINNKFIYKSNFDVEIALDVALHIQDIDLVIIGSGDSDFLQVKQFAFKHKKKFMVLCFEKGIAWEMRKCYHLFLEDLKSLVAL